MKTILKQKLKLKNFFQGFLPESTQFVQIWNKSFRKLNNFIQTQGKITKKKTTLNFPANLLFLWTWTKNDGNMLIGCWDWMLKLNLDHMDKTILTNVSLSKFILLYPNLIFSHFFLKKAAVGPQ